MTLHKTFDGEVYYWWDDDRQQASKVLPKEEKQIVTNEKDKVPKRVFLRACHPDSPNHNCTWTLDEDRKGSVQYVRADLLTTKVKEEREAAFKVICVDCAEGDTPFLDEEARWYYHGEGNDAVGCSASKLRIEAAATKGGNDADIS